MRLEESWKYLQWERTDVGDGAGVRGVKEDKEREVFFIAFSCCIQSVGFVILCWQILLSRAHFLALCQSVVGYPTMKRDRYMYPGLVTSYSRLNYLYNTKKTNYGYTDLLLPTNYFPVSRLLDTKLQTKTLRHWVIKIHSDIIALDFKCSFKHANTRCFGNLGATGWPCCCAHLRTTLGSIMRNILNGMQSR